MQIHRRKFLHVVAGAAALPMFLRNARAQTYPTRPVRISVGFPAGGIGDTSARIIGQWLSERLGQAVVIENRPGAGGNVATAAVVGAPPDGHTLLWVTVANATSATLYGNLTFNFIRDIAPVAGSVRATLVLVVHPSFPAKSVPELIAYAKANPGKVNMASAGNGTSTHLAGELFKMTTGIDMVHVPYRGDAPVLTDLIGGQVQIWFGNLPPSLEHIRSGRIRALAVTTAMRSDVLPDVPSMNELVPGFEASFWAGFGVPKGTPAEIVDRLNREINTGLANPKIKTRLGDLGASVLAGSPADFGKLIAAETERWGKVIRTSNIKPE
jgi:tripartite-type tricarboxylate transporter receptor subunit TctC